MTIDFQKMQEDVNTIKEIVFNLQKQIQEAPAQSNDDRPMSLSEAADYLGVAGQTIYQNIRKIPHYKQFGKLYFVKADLLAYLGDKQGKGRL